MISILLIIFRPEINTGEYTEHHLVMSSEKKTSYGFSTSFYLAYCDVCIHHILYGLSNGVCLDTKSSAGCNTAEKLQGHWTGVKVLTGISAWLSDDGLKWKFTNDTRRKILKTLKTSQTSKTLKT